MYDVWKSHSNETITVNGNGTRKVKVAIYCRVSTDHFEQVKALDNQIKWFDDIIKKYPNWELVSSYHTAHSKHKKNNGKLVTINGYYIDEGLSGLSATNRPAFQQLVKDAMDGKIDLIITREVCRFSRNILDTIKYSRMLKEIQYGVAIYFYNDGIFTYNCDADLRLGIFSTLAQNESQKISERVRSGQETSKSKNILYGNGNILGYSRNPNSKSNSYIINEEQANTIRRIFELYLDGNGSGKIAKILTMENHKNSSGNVKWTHDTILRILHNKTYCGYVSYNRTLKLSCFEKRYTVKENERVFKKVPEEIVPVIIEETIFEECQKRLQKNKKEELSSKTITGKRTSAKDTFAKKLRCKCGHSFKREKWYVSKDGKSNYGYICYNGLNNGHSTNYSNSEAIDNYNICDMPGISEVKLKIQALKIFNDILNDDTLIDDVIKEKRKTLFKRSKNYDNLIAEKNKEINLFKEREHKLTIKLADGIIEDELFNTTIQGFNKEIHRIQNEIENLKLEKATEKEKPEISEDEIRDIFKSLLSYNEDVDLAIIDKFVYEIIVDSPNHFIWKLHFKPITNKTSFIDLCSYRVELDFIEDYYKKHKKILHKKKWEPINIDIQIAI